MNLISLRTKKIRLRISYIGNGKCFKEVLASAKEKGISIKVESTTGTPTLWSFALIKNVDKDFDPTVTVGADIEAITNVMDNVKSDTLKFTQVSFAHSGDLPGEAEVKLDLSQEVLKKVKLYTYTILIQLQNCLSL